MYQLKVSETVFPGAELQLSLRLSARGLSTFLGTEELDDELSDGAGEELEPLRRYMAAIAAKLPELIEAGSPILLEHQIAQLEQRNAHAAQLVDVLGMGLRGCVLPEGWDMHHPQATKRAPHEPPAEPGKSES